MFAANLKFILKKKLLNLISNQKFSKINLVLNKILLVITMNTFI